MIFSSELGAQSMRWVLTQDIQYIHRLGRKKNSKTIHTVSNTVRKILIHTKTGNDFGKYFFLVINGVVICTVEETESERCCRFFFFFHFQVFGNIFWNSCITHWNGRMTSKLYVTNFEPIGPLIITYVFTIWVILFTRFSSESLGVILC